MSTNKKTFVGNIWDNASTQPNKMTVKTREFHKFTQSNVVSLGHFIRDV